MAPAKACGVLQYVHGKNMHVACSGDASGGKPCKVESFEDLKVFTPTPKTTATRSKSQQQLYNARDNECAAKALRPRPFYETDNSSTSGTSTTASVKRDQSEVELGQQSGLASNGHLANDEASGSAASSDDEYEDDGSGEDFHKMPPKLTATTVEITGQLNQKQIKMISRQDSRKRGRTGLPYVKGDSYPDTTSGRPSASDSEDVLDSQKIHHRASALSASRAQFPERQNTMRMPLGSPTERYQAQGRKPLSANQSRGPRDQDGLYATQKGLVRPPEHEETIFSFGKPPNKQAGMTLPGGRARQQRSSQHSESQQTTSTALAHIGSVPDGGEAAQAESKRYNPQMKLESDLVDTEKEQMSSKENRGSSNLTPIKQQVPQASPEYEQLSDFEEYPNHNTQDQLEHQEDLAHHQEVQLDYTIPGLYQMEYGTLKTESFDADPNALAFVLPSIKQTDSLPQKLTVVSASEPRLQAEFFASLTIDQWEDAGEWFLSRFSEMVGRYKAARREKRRTACQFEDEIDSRHVAVGKKRKLTEDALSEMKTSGAQVLRGTPKKKTMP